MSIYRYVRVVLAAANVNACFKCYNSYSSNLNTVDNCSHFCFSLPTHTLICFSDRSRRRFSSRRSLLQYIDEELKLR